MVSVLWLTLFIFGSFCSRIDILIDGGVVQENCTCSPLPSTDTIKTNQILPLTDGGAITVGGVQFSIGSLNSSSAVNVNNGTNLNLNNGSTLKTTSGSTTTFANRPEFQNGILLTSPSGALTIAIDPNRYGPSTLIIPAYGSFNSTVTIMVADNTTGEVFSPQTPGFPHGVVIGSGTPINSYTNALAGTYLRVWNNYVGNDVPIKWTKVDNLVVLHVKTFNGLCDGTTIPQFKLPTNLWTAGDTTTQLEQFVPSYTSSGTGLANVIFSNGYMYPYYLTTVSSTTGAMTFGVPNGACGLREFTISYFMA